MCEGPNVKENWESMTDVWMGAVAVGGEEKVRVFSTRPTAGKPGAFPVFSIKVPSVSLLL